MREMTKQALELDTQEILREVDKVARESLAALFRPWLDVPDCDAQLEPQTQNRRPQ
jgi:hypothetical protein